MKLRKAQCSSQGCRVVNYFGMEGILRGITSDSTLGYFEPKISPWAVLIRTLTRLSLMVVIR